jgi:Na+/melibiose symporter-like transporter
MHTVKKKISPPSDIEYFLGCAAPGLLTKPASLFIIYFYISGFAYMGACVKNTAEL